MFLGDLEKYADLLEEVVLNLVIKCYNEELIHVHMSRGMEIFDRPIKEIYQQSKMKMENIYHFEGCKGCDYIDVCESGCRMTAKGHTGKHSGMDPLFRGSCF